MPEGTVGLAPDSTGTKVRTRSRVVGANTVHEQYVVLGKEAVVTNRAWLCTPFRVRTRAVAAAGQLLQTVFTIWNGGTNLVQVRRISVEADTIQARAQLSPWLRLYRITAAPTGGTAITPFPQDTGDTALSAGITALGDFATSDTGTMPTAITATPNPTSPGWSQVLWRHHVSGTGYVAPQIMSLLPNDPQLNAQDPLVLRPSQGLMVRAETITGSIALSADDWLLHVKAAIGEFTYA